VRLNREEWHSIMPSQENKKGVIPHIFEESPRLLGITRS
jgi:hypothetical protein